MVQVATGSLAGQLTGQLTVQIPVSMLPGGGAGIPTTDLTLGGRNFYKRFDGNVANLDVANFVTDDLAGNNKWHSYLPYSPGYGGAFLTGPGDLANTGLPEAATAPLVPQSDHLIIRAYRGLFAGQPDNWHTGILSTTNQRHEGVTFGIGDYIEAEVKMPSVSGQTWPAFWGVTEQLDWYYPGVGFVKISGEFDVFEWYGRDPTKFSSGSATWRVGVGGLVNNGTGLTDYGIDFRADWHKFGGYLGADNTIIYLDRQEVASWPTHEFHKTHQFAMMINSEIEGTWQADPPSSPFDFLVRYADIYTEIV